jgi:hypothetical protein
MVAWKPPMSPEIKNTSWGTVHSDNTDSAKINFIIGGKLSEMLWFSDIDLLAPAQTMTGSRHRRAIDLGTLKVVHRASFTAALVNAEPLHYIINTQEHRYAIQCPLYDRLTGSRVSYSQAFCQLKLAQRANATTSE